MRSNSLKTMLLIVAFGLLGIQSSRSQAKEQQQKPPTVEEIFKSLDADEDDQLSEKEAKGPLKKDFKKIDENEDGFISRAEMEKAPRPDCQGPPKRNN